MEVLRDGGIVLGIFPDAKYSDVAVQIDPGNKLLLFTDGITEATNTSGEEYGEHRLRQELDGDASGETLSPISAQRASNHLAVASSQRLLPGCRTSVLLLP
jgi:serine phosphatase RsbU (regulator of sigma subunit)